MKITDTSRIHWACRRGMLELDQLLEGYFLKQYPHASEKEQQLFVDLLASADQDLFRWLLGESEPDNDDFKFICKIIREAYIQD
jgi:antitoxin CptB